MSRIDLAEGRTGVGTAASATKWLGLAATPTFAVMALMTTDPGGGAVGMVCSAAPASVLSGMAPMYWLMSAFHAPAWLRLLFSR